MSKEKIAVIFVTLLVLTYALAAIVVFGHQEVTPEKPGSYFGGLVYTGNYIRVGVNDYGALGVYDSDLGDVGFQYPIGYNYESLAVGWWGEGWSVFYGKKGAGFSPGDDAWGTIVGVTPTVSSTATPYGYLHTVEITTNDNVLLLRFIIEFFKEEKYIKIETYITNIGSSSIEDLEYKRIVDWDVWKPLLDSFNNYWGMDDIRKPRLNLAVAFLNETIAPGSVYMGFASLESPTDYDLDWDDYLSRGIYDPLKASISIDGKTSLYDDFCVVYDWVLGELNPGETKAVHMIYAVGDTLEELEGNVEKALKQYAPVGGIVVQTPELKLLIAAAITIAFTTVAVVVLKRRINTWNT